MKLRNKLILAKSLTLTVVGLGLETMSEAAIYTWDGGAATTNWTDAANWNADGIQAPLGVTAAHRLNINSTQKVVYNFTTATTNYTGDTATGGGRGLVIGSGTNARGELEITAGTFSTFGATAGDVIGNGSGAIGTLTVSGGTFIGTNAGTNLGIGGGPTSTLNVSSGLARVANLNMNATTANINLSGTGVLEVNSITRTAGSTGNLTFNGGTLKARQNSTTFVTGLSAVNIGSGGATIDSNGFNVTIGNILGSNGGSGNLTKNGAGTLTLTAVPGFTGSTTVNNGELAYDIAGNYNYNNTIDGAGSIVKSGAGVMTLTASSGFTGSTSITGGTLALSGSGAINSTNGITVNGSGAIFNASGSVAVSSAVTLTNGTVTGSGTVNTINVGSGTGGIISNNNGAAGAALNVGTLTLAGGANITLYSNGADTSAALNVTSLTNNSAANAVTLTANNALGWSNGATYTIIDYGTIGGTGGYNFTTVANNLSARQIGTFSDTGSAITLGITGDSVFWTGNTNTKWNTSDTNWQLLAGGTVTQFIAADDVIFDDSGANTNIDIDTANVAANSVNFNNTSGTNYNIGSSGGFGIEAGSVTKNNTGSVTISSVNSYSGATVVNNGSLTISGSLGATAITVNGGILKATTNASALGTSTLNLAGGELQLANDTGLSFGRNTTVSGNAQLTSDTLTSVAGVIHALGTLSIGSNTLTVAKGVNATGATSGVTFGATSLTGAARFSVGADATLSLGAVSNGGNTATITGAGNFIQTGVWGNGAGGITFDSGFSGIATLSQVNTYTGVTTINGGRVIAGNNAALGSNAGGTTVSGTGVLDINNKNLGTEIITIAGSGDGNGALVNSGADQINAVGRLVLSGDAAIGGVNRWDLRNSSPTLNMGGFTLTKTGSNYIGMVAVTVSNPGNVDVASGIFSLQTATSLGGSSANTFTVRNGAILSSWQAANAVAWSLDMRDGSTLRAESAALSTNNNWSGPVTIQNSGSVTIDAQASMTLSGGISGNGSGIIKTGNGNQTFSGTSANTYSGMTTVNSGNLLLAKTGSVNAIAGGGLTIGGASNTAATVQYTGDSTDMMGAGTVIINGRGSLDFNGKTDSIGNVAIVSTGATTSNPTPIINTAGGGNLTIGTLSITPVEGFTSIVNSSTGTLTLGGDITFTAVTTGRAQISGNLDLGSATRTFAVGLGTGTSYDVLVDGSISSTAGAFGITKDGAGRMILSGTNNYSGSTIVNNGELRVTSANAIAGTSGITVNSGRFSLDGGISTGSGKSISINGSGGNFYGALQSNSGNNVWEGDVVIGATAGTRIGANAGSLRILGAISGSTAANGVTFRLNAGTVLELSGASTYAGDTTIISGTSIVTLSSGSNRLPTGTRLIFGGSAVSGILNLNGQNQEIAGLSVASGTANEIRSTSAAVLTVNTAAASPSNWGGLISGAISLTKTGSETLTLTAANTYTGTTTVTQGSLVLSGAGSVANSGRIHLAASTTLDIRGVTGGFTLGASQSLTGVGTISALGQTVTAAGTLSPGNSPGALIQDGGILALGAGGNLNWQVYDATGSAGVGYDTVSLINNASLSLTSLSNANPYLINLWSLSGINVDVNGDAINFDAAQNYTWTLFSTSSEITDFNSDLFQINVGANNGTSGFSNSLNGGIFTVALADNNTDLVLQFTAVPETSVTLLGGLSALLLLRRKRRIA